MKRLDKPFQISGGRINRSYNGWLNADEARDISLAATRTTVPNGLTQEEEEDLALRFNWCPPSWNVDYLLATRYDNLGGSEFKSSTDLKTAEAGQAVFDFKQDSWPLAANLDDLVQPQFAVPPRNPAWSPLWNTEAENNVAAMLNVGHYVPLPLTELPDQKRINEEVESPECPGCSSNRDIKGVCCQVELDRKLNTDPHEVDRDIERKMQAVAESARRLGRLVDEAESQLRDPDYLLMVPETDSDDDAEKTDEEITRPGPVEDAKQPGSEPKWSVDKLVAFKIMDDKHFYLVKWEGYPSSENTWEPEETLKEDCPDEIYDFWRSRRSMNFSL